MSHTMTISLASAALEGREFRVGRRAADFALDGLGIAPAHCAFAFRGWGSVKEGEDRSSGGLGSGRRSAGAEERKGGDGDEGGAEARMADHGERGGSLRSLDVS